jgi:hypothetical protein
METPNRGDERTAIDQECRLGLGWLLMLGFKELNNRVEVSSFIMWAQEARKLYIS